MRTKTILILLIVNSLLLLFYIFPIQDIIGLISTEETGAGGIIGGADGPTAIFISTRISWYLTTLIVMETVLAAGLVLTSLQRLKNKR